MDDLISRQAAIDRLTEYGNGRAVFISVGEAVIRIEQLPPIQPVNCSEFPNNSDTISRQAAINAVGELATFTEDWSCHTWMYTDDVYNAIKQLPPIQPKRGKWHYSDGKPATIGLSFGVICDQCGTESEYCTNFCGECGSDMREVTT